MSSSSVGFSFVRADGSEAAVTAYEEDTLLDAAQENDVDEVEGACGGECACSTCHVILPQELFDALPEPSEDEMDMLDLAIGVQDTSRLGCQVQVTKALFEGRKVRLPDEVLNLYQE